jgi:hypothetical protein
VGKSKYCRSCRAESRARFKDNLARWKAEAEVKKAMRDLIWQVEHDGGWTNETLAEFQSVMKEVW